MSLHLQQPNRNGVKKDLDIVTGFSLNCTFQRLIVLLHGKMRVDEIEDEYLRKFVYSQRLLRTDHPEFLKKIRQLI